MKKCDECEHNFEQRIKQVPDWELVKAWVALIEKGCRGRWCGPKCILWAMCSIYYSQIDNSHHTSMDESIEYLKDRIKVN